MLEMESVVQVGFNFNSLYIDCRRRSRNSWSHKWLPISFWVPSGKFKCSFENIWIQWGECVFSANTSSGFCKCRGWYVGDGVSHCGPPEIHYNVEPNQYNEGQRHHHPGNLGSWKSIQSSFSLNWVLWESSKLPCSCSMLVVLLLVVILFIGVASGRSNPPALCQCRQGFEGNGTHCTAKDEVARLPADNNKICADQSECHQFAHCILVESKNTYYCSCLHGYKGDGHTKCVKSGRRKLL